MRVSRGFSNWFEREQVECLHGTTLHCRYTQRSLLAVFLQNKYPPKRLRLVSTTPHRRYRVDLCPRCCPSDLVHTRGVLALVFSHPFDRECSAAKRVGEQPLQGSRLIVMTHLCCLDNTRLQPSYLMVNGDPIDVVPRHVRGCTRECCCTICFPSVKKVLHTLLSRETTKTSARLHVRRCSNPYPSRYKAAFAFSSILFPQHHRQASRLAVPDGSDTGLPRFACRSTSG